MICGFFHIFTHTHTKVALHIVKDMEENSIYKEMDASEKIYGRCACTNYFGDVLDILFIEIVF